MGVVIGIYAGSGSISWNELGDSMRVFGVSGCALSLLFLCGQIVFMILRYWALVPGEHAPSLLRIAYAVSVGQAVNNFFPARAGDFIKAALLTRNPKAAFSRSAQVVPDDRRFTFLKAMGLVVADRIVDIGTLILLVIFSGALMIPGDLMGKDKLPSTSTVLLVLAALAVVMFVARHAVGRKVAEKMKKLTAWFREFRGGFRGMLNPRQLAMGIVFAGLSWWCEILSLQTLSGLQGFPMTFAQSVFVLLALNFFISVPLSIANFGPFEAGVVMALQAVEKIPTEQALAVATVHHIAQMASVTILAVITFLLARIFLPKPR